MKPRVVLDTNVFVSAILYGGNPRKIVHLAISEAIEVFSSPSILDEFSRILSEKFSLSAFEVENFLFEIRDFARIIEPKVKLKVIKKDLSDDRILECATWASADFIVSGDEHLLELGEFRKIKIVSPSQFLTIVGKA